MPGNKIRVGILGVSGHTGEELLRWLLRHNHVEISYLGARQRIDSIKEIYPWVDLDLCVEEINCEKVKRACDCVFLALPHTVSQQYVPYLYPDIVVIDLSADYRLKHVEIYEKWYKVKHSSPFLLKNSVYGLPELFREKISRSRLIANPGCYSTSIILGLFPLAERGLINSVIIDAKSGASGAGRKLIPNLLFSNLVNNLYPYKANSHQHMAEISAVLNLQEEVITFVPHIVGIDRGILSTMYVYLKQEMKLHEVEEVFNSRYSSERFIIVSDNLPSYHLVQYTNNCYISFRLLTSNMLLVVSAIDNLVKGASGQAIQNMNVVFGLEEKEGLV